MIAKLLLPLAVTLTGAAAQFGSAVSVSATFKNEDQATSFLGEFETLQSQLKASATQDPNWSVYTAALPTDEASQISVGLEADPTDLDAVSAADALQTWPTNLPTGLPSSVSSWASQVAATAYCQQSSLWHKYGASVPSETGVTCNSGAGTVSPVFGPWAMPMMVGAAGAIAGAAMLL